MPSSVPTVKFPAQLDDSTSLFRPFNIYKWKSGLKVAIDANPATIILTLKDSVNIPLEVANNFIGIDDEIMFVESIDNSDPTDKKITVIRAVDDSTIATHLVDALVQVVISAQYIRQIEDAVIAIETQVGNSPFASVVTNYTVNATPYDILFNGHKNFVYEINVSCKNVAGTEKMVKIFRINHWNDNTNPPEAIETFISSIGSAIDITIRDLTAGLETMTIRITGCPSGSAKVKTTAIGVSI